MKWGTKLFILCSSQYLPCSNTKVLNVYLLGVWPTCGILKSGMQSVRLLDAHFPRILTKFTELPFSTHTLLWSSNLSMKYLARPCFWTVVWHLFSTDSIFLLYLPYSIESHTFRNTLRWLDTVIFISFLNFMDGEVEIWNGYVACRRSHSWKAMQVGLVSFSPGCAPCLSWYPNCSVGLLGPMGNK